MAVRDIIQAAGGSAATSAAVYVEDVFSTYLYTGTGAAQTINNGIDLATKGGLVWVKPRENSSIGSNDHFLCSSASSFSKAQSSNTTSANAFVVVPSVNTTGFVDAASWETGRSIVSWTFRKQAKFFDVVTYTGDGAGTQLINHNLGVQASFIIIKRTDSTGNWNVSARVSDGIHREGLLNTTDVGSGQINVDNYSTATQLKVGDNHWNKAPSNATNISGATYVAYLFAHNAGGFGAAGTDSVVACGSYTPDGSGKATVNLGWEPQFVITRNITSASNWVIADTMRGLGAPSAANTARLYPNLSDAEAGNVPTLYVSSNGFSTEGSYTAAGTYIYLAIRRGPMKTPTDATKVFAPVARTGTGSSTEVTSGFVTDFVIEGNRTSTNAASKYGVWDRFRGNNYLNSNTTGAQVAAATTIVPANPWDTMTGFKVGTTSILTNASASTFINWMFARAPGFFDLVHYSGNNTARYIDHNLGVEPEMMIVKCTNNSSTNWRVYFKGLLPLMFRLNTGSNAVSDSTVFDSTTPTSTQFRVGTSSDVNTSGNTYVAYLFASCPGVSQIGSYTGTGTTINVNCGFASGARFVLIKNDGLHDWMVLDAARGIISGNDRSLTLNNANSETNSDVLAPYSTGFSVITTWEAFNESGQLYYYLAIA